MSAAPESNVARGLTPEGNVHGGVSDLVTKEIQERGLVVTPSNQATRETSFRYSLGLL
jgi:hypothetical protein